MSTSARPVTLWEAFLEGLITPDTDLAPYGININVRQRTIEDALLTTIRPVKNSRILERWHFDKVPITARSLPPWAVIRV